MKIFTILLTISCSLSAFAGDAIQANLSGTWVGNRYQFNADKNAYEQVFTYMYDLKQDGNLIKGTSYIKNDKGNFAEIAVRGLIEGNTLYFEEYEVLRAERPEGKIWCLKKGEIKISQKGNDWILSGETPSYSEEYGDPCSGGVSYMSKLADGNDPIPANPTQKQIADIAAEVGEVNINSYPNPFYDRSIITFNTSSTQEIKVEVIDVSGKTIATLFSGIREAGNYQIGFDANKFGFDNRLLIAKVTVGDQVFSKTMVQVK